MRIITTLFFVLLLISCVGVKYQHPYVDAPHATFQNPEEEVISQFHWRKYFVQQIDSVDVNYSDEAWSGIYGSTKRVAPGSHILTIRATFNYDNSGVFFCLIDIEASLEEGKNYILEGETTLDGVRVWLKDKESGKIASNIGFYEAPIPNK